jgi:CRP-like cAMP-binding protein
MSLRPATPDASTSDSEKFGKLREMAFFKDFGEVELWEVVRIGTWQAVPAGTVLVRENDHADSFYLLVDGEVDVTLDGKSLAVLKPGSCFGELLYFAETTERRTTSVTARGAITAMCIKAAALRGASAPCQVGFNKAFMQVLFERLAQANRQLAQR